MKKLFKRRFKMPKVCVPIVIIIYALIGLGAVIMTIKTQGAQALFEKKTIIVEKIEEEVEEVKNIEEEKSEIKEANVSAYTSRIAETDASPYITADGTNLKEVFECVVASNEYEFGTRLAIEGLGVCEVHDRMNSRYGEGYMDVYMGNDLIRANEFGRRKLSYIVIE